MSNNNNNPPLWGKIESLYAKDNDYDVFSQRYPNRSWTAYRKHRRKAWGLSSWRTGFDESLSGQHSLNNTQENLTTKAFENMAKAFQPVEPKEPVLTNVEMAREKLANLEFSRDQRSYYAEHAKVLEVFDGITKSLPSLLPPRILGFTHKRRSKGKRTMVLLYSDGHCGLKSESKALGGLGGFDFETWTLRHERLRSAVLDAQQDFGADELVEFGLGDLMDGSDIFKSHAFHIDKSVPEQIVHAGNRLAEDTSVYASAFENVRHFYVYGNHGRKGRFGENPYAHNYEHVIYEFAKASTREIKNVSWQGSDSWYQVVDVLGKTFLILHGDDIRSYGAGLAGGIRQTKQQYMMMLNMPLDYICTAHHHQALNDEHALANGSIVGASEFTAKNLAVSGMPSQKIFMVEEGLGVTWKQDIPLATKDELRNIVIQGR